MAKKNFTFSIDEEIMQIAKQIATTEDRSLSDQIKRFIKQGIAQYNNSNITTEIQPEPTAVKNEWFTAEELYNQLNINIGKQRFLKVLLNSNTQNKTINGIHYFKKN